MSRHQPGYSPPVHLFSTFFGFVNSFMRMPSQGAEVRGLHLTLPLRGHRRARDLPPDPESLGHGLALHGSRSQVASRTEVRGDKAIRRQEALRMPGGFESLHAPLPLVRRLVEFSVQKGAIKLTMPSRTRRKPTAMSSPNTTFKTRPDCMETSFVRKQVLLHGVSVSLKIKEEQRWNENGPAATGRAQPRVS
jgi:hypothetical protein